MFLPQNNKSNNNKLNRGKPWEVCVTFMKIGFIGVCLLLGSPNTYIKYNFLHVSDPPKG